MASPTATSAKPSPQQQPSLDLTTLSAPQLTSLKTQLDTELSHLTTSFTRLRAAQAKFRDCLASIAGGVSAAVAPRALLVPLTTSLYVPGTLADADRVIVDVGTGFYVEKTTGDATAFYTEKVEELGRNLRDLERVVQGKSGNLRVVEDVLRQKVLSGEDTGTAQGGQQAVRAS